MGPPSLRSDDARRAEQHGLRHRIGKRLLAGLCLLIGLLIINAGLGYQNSKNLHYNSVWVSQKHDVLTALERLLSTIKDAETGQRGYLLTGDELYLEPYQEARNAIDEQFEAIERMTADSDRRRAELARLKELVRAKLNELAQTIALRRDAGFDAARQVVA